MCSLNAWNISKVYQACLKISQFKDMRMAIGRVLNKVRRRISSALSGLQYIGLSPSETVEKKLLKVLGFPHYLRIPSPPKDFRISPCGKRRDWSRVVPFRKRVYSEGFGSDSLPRKDKHRRTFYLKLNCIPEETQEELDEYEREEDGDALAVPASPFLSITLREDSSLGEVERQMMELCGIDLPQCCYDVENVFITEEWSHQ